MTKSDGKQLAIGLAFMISGALLLVGSYHIGYLIGVIGGYMIGKVGGRQARNPYTGE